MATHTDQAEFEISTAAARAQHQEAIRSAQARFANAVKGAGSQWAAKIAEARQRFDEVKSEVRVPDKVRDEYFAALASSPDLEETRHQLKADTVTADEALNAALAEARRKLAAA
jgi:hypothetical protein